MRSRGAGRLSVFALATVLLTCPLPAAQTQPPVIHARSKIVTIIDGLHEKKDYWYVMPERSPEVYFVELPRLPHKVTFVTDVESISFDVTYGSRHAFVIQLADGTMAPTEIRAEYRGLLAPRTTTGPVGDPAVIPFTLGDNDKTCVKGAIIRRNLALGCVASEGGLWLGVGDGIRNWLVSAA